MESQNTEKNLHTLFLISLGIKTFDGVLEIAGGLALILLKASQINTLFLRIARRELLEQPHDKYISYLQHLFLTNTSHMQTFAGLYILAHGILNIFLVISIYKEKLWAYWVAIVCIGLFMIFQIYRLTYGYSLGLIVLTVFDMIFILLTWHEYKHHRRRIHGF